MSRWRVISPPALRFLVLWLLSAGACDWPWALDGPYDPTRCGPPCQGPQECFEGRCVPRGVDARVDLEHDSNRGDTASWPDKQRVDSGPPDTQAWPDTQTWPDTKAWPDTQAWPDLKPAPTCNDKIKNGDETDVDCGGSSCSPCGVGKKCAKAQDCGGLACDTVALICLTTVCNQQVEYYISGKLLSVTCPAGVIHSIVHATYGAQIGNPTCAKPTSSKGWCPFSIGTCVGKKSCAFQCGSYLCGYDPCFGYVGQCTLKVACK